MTVNTCVGLVHNQASITIVAVNSGNGFDRGGRVRQRRIEPGRFSPNQLLMEQE
jgi:hypothetical protein